MKIEWEITKKQGNLRPRLVYRIVLEPFEVQLGMPVVTVESWIPKPPDAWETVVYPGRNERTANWIPDTFYELSTPAHKTGVIDASLVLPYREEADYPEVETSFVQLRDAFEQELKKAGDSKAFRVKGILELTPEARRRIAPGIAAERMLRAIGA